MGDQHNFAALEWVVGEIEETLDEARQALEAYVEDPKDSTRIRFCLTHIHQVLGSLRMVELNGPSLLAEEMEHVAQAIMNNNVSSVSDALEILMRSLLQLPIYLNHIKIYRDDSATHILPLLNDLRAVRKEHYLSESNLFAPNLSSLKTVQGKRHPILDDPKKLAPLLKKLREMYQFAAASVLRGLKVDENLDYLEKVFTRLETLSRGTSIHPLWSVASALIEGIKLDEIELSVGVRGLLRYLARDLRVLAEKSPTSFDQIPNTNVFKNLLFYVGRAGNTSSKITAIKARYDLIAALKSSSTDHDGASSSGPALDPEAIRSVVVALVDELNSIKMNLNNTLTGHLGTEELRDVLPVLKRVADTLAVLGISELRKQMLDQVTRLDALSRANELDEGELTLIATNIITVEQRLEAIGKAVGKARDINKIDERKVEIDEAKLVVVKECQFGLEKAKDAIIDYISSNWDASRLENIDLLLADIRGGLEIIPLLRPASIVRACSQFIKDKLVDDQEKPEWSLMESLADAIASVDYYLERLLSDMNEDVNVILDRAEESIKELGYGEMLSAPSAQEQLQAEELAKENDVDKPSVDQDKDEKTHENNNASSDHTNESIVPLAGLTVSNDESRDNTTTDTVTVEASELSTDIDNEDQSATVTNDVPSESNIAQTIAVEDAVVAEKPEDVVSEDRPEEVVAEKPTESIVATEKVVEQVVEKPAEEAIDDEEEDYIDEEILEIFIEEATEVLETLNEYLPQWIANNDDQEALTTVRRAFHTLKGSGRMVKASDISELAWEVENMLNRVIDNSVTLTPEYGQLIENVVGFLPPLVSAFEHKKGDPDPVKNAAYQEWAKLLSKGTIPDNLFVLGTPDTESSNVEETISSEPEAVTQAEEEHSLESSETFDVNTPEVAVEIQAEELQDDDDDEQEDMVLWEIFSSEAKSHLATIEEFVVQMEDEAPIYSPPSNDLQRALHTLKGSAKMAQVTNIAKMAEPLENFAKELVTYQVPLNDDILQLIRDAAEYTHLGLASIERGGSVEIPKLDQFIARTAELRELAVGHLIRLKELDPHSQNQVDPRLLSIFMAEEMLLLLDADQLLAHWEQNITDTGQIVELMSELSKLAEGAAQANLPDMALLSESLRCVYLRMMADELPVTSENIHDLYNGHNALLDMVDAVAAGQTVQAPPVDIVTRIQTLIEQTHVVDGLDLTPVDTTDNEGEDLVLEDTVSEELVLEELVVEEPVVEEVLDEVVDAAAEEDPADEYLPLDSDNTELLGLTSIDTADNEDEDLVLEEVVFENLVLEELVAEEPVVEDVVLDESVSDTEDDAGDEYVSLDDNNTELLDLTLADATEGEDEDLVLEELVSEEPVLEELVVEEPVVEDVVLDESVSDAEDDVGDEYVSLDDDNTELLDLTLADTTEGEDEELVLEELVVEEPVVEDVVLDEIVFDTEDNVGDEYVSLDDDNTEVLDLTLVDATDGEDEDLVLEELVSEEPVLEELIAEEPVVEDVVLDEIVLDTEDDIGDEYVSLDNDNTELLDLTLADVTDGEDEDLVLEELVSEEPVLEELVVEEPVVEDVVLDEIVLDTEDDVGDEYVSLDNDNTELLDLTLADVTDGEDEDLVLEELVSEEPVLEELVVEEPVVEDVVLDEIVLDTEDDVGDEYVSLDNDNTELLDLTLADVTDGEDEDLVLEELVSEEPVLEELVVEEPVVEDVVLDEIVLDTEDDAGDEYVSLDNDNTELLDLTLADTTEGQDEDLVLEELVSEEPVFEEPVFEEPATVEERLDMLAQDVQSDGGSLDNADVSFIPGLLDTIDRNSEDFDEDIVEVFLEEADELSEDLDEAIHAWQNDRSDLAPLEIITRALHTYKGGARLAALTNLGELTHDYETYLLSIKPSEANDTFFERIHEFQDQVLSAIRAVKVFMASDFVYVQADDGKASTPVVDTSVVDTPVVDVAETTLNDQSDVPEQVDHEQEEIGLESNVANDDVDSHAALPVSEQIAEKQETEKQEDVAPKPESAPEKEVAQRVELPARDNNVVPFARSKPATPAEPSEFSMPSIPNSLTAGSALAKKSAPQELVKVPAELLEELVNLAGETSISRSRLEEQVTEFSYSLDEIDATLHRMQEQIRRLDIETEAQILFRQEQLAAHEEFDPLEMDRYSQLQQLSRSLIESASDLEDLKTDLNEKLRDTETLLIQQSRINTSLQEGLMRSRMVPFSRLVPRLRRIVRQVAAELGKNVSFELDNIEGELDRTVLERMVPPFEHMLRNAVDHGIEMPEDRLANGKAEAGRIVLTLGREGGDVIIRLADDGRGINLKRVREKAIEREMMSPNAELSDHDVMQFILHSGFSTAENITQISGRGVGMDVVHSEIKQLGGSVVIDSEWGKGTEFVVRLPFTLSVNRALMVQIGSDQYAIPLSSIEGIVRVSPFELEHYYSSADAQFEYANENYHVRYLGSMLNADLRPKLEGHVLPLPVLLVRSAEHTMAIQVDGLLGSREVVVKSLGQQFSTVLGLSGATVMGDGSVVVILDPHALVRQEIAVSDNSHLIPLELEVTPTIQAPEQLVQTIMVVDDSVTVRKVTTRFLERQGFEVITAKDGVDALRVLQDTIPDLMLLDIEMPRMDGFEVAKNVRTTSRWSDLPIIMITSRTGEKHRDHAFSLGVNNYLGKPYQEDILLSAIHELLDARSATKH